MIAARWPAHHAAVCDMANPLLHTYISVATTPATLIELDVCNDIQCSLVVPG